MYLKNIIFVQELEKRRVNFGNHASQVLKKAGETPTPIDKLSALVEGMDNWPGNWSSNFSRDDIKRWLEQAQQDPGFPSPVLKNWITQAESQFEHERTRYNFASLFGNLLTDWLKSAPRDLESTAMALDSEEDGAGTAASVSSEGFERVSRKETLEQKAKLESIIFEEKKINTEGLELYLHDLFSSKEASEALESLKTGVRVFAKGMRTQKIDSDVVENIIASTLRTDVLSDEKQSLLKQFAKNPTVVEELASVLTMQLQSLQTWSWPKEGVLVEPRRHLNGKTRFYLDTEILTCLLFHYIGTSWAVEFRSLLATLKGSRAWKEPKQYFDKRDLERREAFLGEKPRENTVNIKQTRKTYQSDHFFMCQLPDSIEASMEPYEDIDTDHVPQRGGKRGKGGHSGPKFDTPIDLKQSLLHILSADMAVNVALRKSCTLVRTDLEWFGPSLPFDTILTILRFLDVPEQELHFFRAFLSCPIVFKDDPSSSTPRTRKRGVPISYMLSTLFGELTMFIMDFGINQRADGLFLYRIHDDFWFCDWDNERCAAAWQEMGKFASLAGLSFNESKTGSVCVGGKLDKRLPTGDVRWGFLVMDKVTGSFVIDQEMIDAHILELRRQLNATTSVFAWVQAYNKYMAFVVRNCGQPAMVYGKAHVDGIIETLARIQRALFPASSEGTSGQSSFVNAVSKMLRLKFDVDTKEVPLGWYLWPNAAGGLEVKDFFVDLFAMRGQFFNTPAGIIDHALWKDKHEYDEAKRMWDEGTAGVPSRGNRNRKGPDHAIVSPGDAFMSIEEFNKAREERGTWWANAYNQLLNRPAKCTTQSTPQIDASIKLLGEGLHAFHGKNWYDLSPYWQWVIALHHDEMVRTFGSLAVVEAGTIPVGMVDVFKGSRTRWEQ